ncbi:rod shape-determining protein MreC [Atopobiaceae bacterium 24-176]
MPFPSMAGPGLKRGSSSRVRVLALLLVVSAVLFTFSANDSGAGPLSAVKGAVQTVCLPFRYVGAALSSPFSGLSNLASNLTADQGSLSDLKAENERLKAENAQLKESSLAAERLEQLLGLQNTYRLESTGARVISGAVDSLTSTITIDKGSAQGIAVGMPVTDSYGVIGQVSSVGPASAQVRLITDERSGVSAMVQSSRAQGQLVGQGTDILRLTLVRTDQAVEVGDLVVTSGLGGVYPKGLLLGTVTSVERPSGAPYYEILVQPAALTSNLEEVLVITSLTQEQTATAEEAAAADAQEAGRAPAQQQSQGSDGQGDAQGAQSAQGSDGGDGQDGAAASGTGDGSDDAGAGGQEGR